jgi:hypothetical protein
MGRLRQKEEAIRREAQDPVFTLTREQIRLGFRAMFGLDPKDL